jgi:hypothetical protein
MATVASRQAAKGEGDRSGPEGLRKPLGSSPEEKFNGS